MPEQEGVIKYRLFHSERAIEADIATTRLNAWRHVLHRLNLIDQQADRYDGLGYGNISARIDTERFLISGTQTGHLEMLDSSHFAVIEHADPELNQLTSYGLTKPSSEALTHAILYQQAPSIKAVIHVHCPEIWRHTNKLSLPHTAADIAYGTVAMVKAVESLFNESKLKSPIFTMLGHKDGVIAFGDDIEHTALRLIQQLSLALEVELNQ